MYEVINPESKASVILLVEHAGAVIPTELNNLGLPVDQFQQDPQMFYDPGSRDMALGIGQALGLPIYCGKLSRLVVDLNREDDHADVIKSRFHGRNIPGNQNLSDADRQVRLDTYYKPFHTALRDDLARRKAGGIPTKLISIHSFNADVAFATFPDLKREPVDIAVLYDEISQLVDDFKLAIKPGNYAFKENYPYDLSVMKTGSILQNKQLFGLDAVGIEINAARLENPAEFTAIQSTLLQAIKAVV